MFRTIVLLMLILLSFVSSDYDDLTFLENFGYLDIGRPSGVLSDDADGGGFEQALIRIPESTKIQAIKEFQKYYGILETGLIDARTSKAMKTPRCGVPDKERGQKTGRVKRYTTTEKKWPKKKLSYRFLNYTSDISQTATRDAFREAFGHWEEASAVQFKEVTERHIKADIEIAYITGVHKDRSPFNSIVLAHAFYPEIGWLHMNDEHRWNHKSTYGTDTVYVALHELGHVLGLKHSRIGSIMHASYPGYIRGLKLTTDDINGVQKLFGTNPCKPRNPCQNQAHCRKKEDRGYTCLCLSGYTGSRCETRSNTSRKSKRCKKLRVQNAVVYPAYAVQPNVIVRVYCKNGFTLSGASKLTCGAAGYYSPRPSQTKCSTRVLCPSLKIVNGTAYPSRGAVPSTVVSFRCIDGYELSGSTKLKCRSDGTYDRRPPTCVEISFKVEAPEVNCPIKFDALVSRTISDSLIYATRGGQYWIYKRGATGAPVSHWKSSAPFESGLPNIPSNLDAAFSFEDDHKRYICWVKWPKVYYMDILTSKIDRILDFPAAFGLKTQITAAIRWDKNTVYFFVPRGYFIYDMARRRIAPSYKQSMSTFRGLSYRVTATGASKAFYAGLFYLFVDEDMYLIRKTDKQVTASSPQKISNAWRHGLATC